MILLGGILAILLTVTTAELGKWRILLCLIIVVVVAVAGSFDPEYSTDEDD